MTPADEFRVALHSDDYFPNIGGVATHVHELAAALVAKGISAGIVTGKPAAGARRSRQFKFEDGAPPVLRLPKQPPVFARVYATACRRAVGRLLSRGADDSRPLIFHSHWHQPWWVQDCQAHVFTNHTSMFLQDVAAGRHGVWQRQLAPFDTVIAPSSELAERTLDFDFTPQQVQYIPNGVNSEQFRPNAEARRELRKQHGIAGDAIVVVCARRIVPKNGVIDFVHAFRYLERDLPQDLRNKTVILIAGDSKNSKDGYQDETLNALLQTDLGRRAVRLGEVPNAQMPAVFAAGDIGVLPSLKEATSIAGLEAMAAGLPLVGTRVGGIPDLIKDGEDGLLVDHGNPPELAAALTRMITQETMRKEMGRRAREKTAREFSWGAIADQTIDVYRRALEVAQRKQRDAT